MHRGAEHHKEHLVKQGVSPHSRQRASDWRRLAMRHPLHFFHIVRECVFTYACAHVHLFRCGNWKPARSQYFPSTLRTPGIKFKTLSLGASTCLPGPSLPAFNQAHFLARSPPTTLWIQDGGPCPALILTEGVYIQASSSLTLAPPLSLDSSHS